MDTNKNSVLLEEGRKELAEALEHGIRSTHAPFALHLEADDKVTTFAFTYLSQRPTA